MVVTRRQWQLGGLLVAVAGQKYLDADTRSGELQAG